MDGVHFVKTFEHVEGFRPRRVGLFDAAGFSQCLSEAVQAGSFSGAVADLAPDGRRLPAVLYRVLESAKPPIGGAEVVQAPCLAKVTAGLAPNCQARWA